MPETDTQELTTAHRLGRLGAVLLAVVCCLSLVVRDQPPAQAFVPGVPILLGSTLAGSPAATGLLVGGGAVTFGAMGLGVLGLGVIAYATKDTWMPMVKDVLNPDDPVITNADGSSPCTGGVYPTMSAVPIDGAQGRLTTVDVTYDVPAGCLYINNYADHDIRRQDKCMNLSTGAITTRLGTSAKIYSSARGVAVSGTKTSATLCLSTEWPVWSKIWIDPGPNGTPGAKSADWIANGHIPDSWWNLKTDVKCERPDGSTFMLSATQNEPLKFGVPSCRQSDPTSHPTEITATEPDGTKAIETVFPDWETDYPNCFGPSGVLCDLQVFVDNVPCEVGVPGCDYWWERRDKPDWKDRIDCKWGPYVVPIGNCKPMRRVYQDNPGDLTVTNPDWPQPEPDPNPDPPTDPDPSPSPSPTPTPTPTPTSNPNPTSGPNPESPPTTPNPESTDPDSRGCFGDAWSWNPVDWVYVPVKCAFIWAFVPKTALSVRVDSIKGLLTAKAPFSWFAGFSGVPVAIPSGQCPDWRIKVNGLDENVVCGRPYTEAIRTARPVLLVFMASLALWPLIRSTAYAAFPIIKPQPGMLR